MFFQHVTHSAIPYRFSHWLTALPALLLLIILAAPTMQAASLTVNSLADADNGSDGVCTLREAITAANNNANYNECASAGYGNDTITFNVGGTITLDSSLPDVTDAAGLTINGGSAVTISGNNAVVVLQVNSDAALTLQNLVIANGNASLLSGGLYNSGTATIDNSTFSNNRGSFGGGIFNASGGTLTISNSSFTGNSATSSGGAVSSSGTLTISNSSFSGNSAESGGGGIDNSSSNTATIDNSTFTANSATNFGGAVSSSGTINFSDSTISGNSANSGGGIANFGGQLSVSDSTISGNSASSNFGGGIYNNGGATTISNSTISGNSANSGGGIFNASSGTVTLGNSTLSGNSANTGGGIDNFSGTMTLTNSIVTNSPLGGNCAGTITNGGHNLDSFTTCGWGSSNGSLSNTLPQLGPLANNGGPTQTHALLQGSPAIDQGNNSLLPPDSADQDGDGDTGEPIPFDQRGPGYFRIVGGIVDMGAFEMQRIYLPIVIK